MKRWSPDQADSKKPQNLGLQLEGWENIRGERES